MRKSVCENGGMQHKTLANPLSRKTDRCVVYGDAVNLAV
jgi:hypothetical protein